MIKNMKLGIKQGLGFGIIIILTAIIGITGWISFKNFNNAVLVADNQNRLIKYVFELRQNEKNYIIGKDPQSAEKALETLAAINNQIDNTEGTLEEDKGLPGMVVAYKKSFEVYVKLVQQQEKQIKEMVIAARKFMKGSEELREDAKLAMNATMNKSKSIIAVLSMASIIFGVLIGFFITRSITLPIKKAVDFAGSLAQGDLTLTMDIDQKDEIGNMAEAFNKTVDKLNKMFKDIALNTETIDSTSSDLSSISKQVTSASEEVSGKSDSVAAAAEEMSSNMDSVAAAVEETSTNVSMVATATEEMTSVISEIASNSENASAIASSAVTDAENASKAVDELKHAAMEIGNVTETITSISEQTNLLALNATIEAARAGEAGKGFAVVANEIKELAMQTSQATKEIKSKIDGIHNSTEGTALKIQQISKVIDEINNISTTIASAVEEQSVTTKEIANNILQASQGIQEVTQNVAQSSDVAGEIAKDISEINQVTTEISNGNAKVNNSAKELDKISGELHELIGVFKINQDA